MRFATLGSGSAGNATLVCHGDDAVLIDCGLSVREVSRRAALLDFDLTGLRAILVTHEHDDHVGGCGKLARRLGVPLFATAGTRLAAATLLDGVQVETLVPDARLGIGALDITPVIVPHDAREPCQFIVGAGGARLGVLTDLGCPTPHLERMYGALDALVLEFNHEPELLERGPYPAALRRRIGGRYGHLSNQQAAALLATLDRICAS